MIETTVKCRVVTPMFSRSEEILDQKDNLHDFELRPQSVKGVLHFWFRAVAPRVIDIYELDLTKLPEELHDEFKDEKFKGLKYLESLIFGSQSRKSPFALMVEWEKNETERIGHFRQKDGGKTIVELSQILGRDANYPLYGLYNLETESRPKLLTTFLKPNAEFKIKVLAKDQETLDVVLAILKLVSVVSGFGAKTTKGFGQFQILDPSFDRTKFLTGEALEKLLTEVEQTLRSFIQRKDRFEALRLGRTAGNVDFPSFLPGKFELIQIQVPGNSIAHLISNLYGIKIERNDGKMRVVRGWYRHLKYSMRFIGENKSGDAVKELVKCITNGTGEADIGPAIIGLPIVYQNLRAPVKKSVTVTPYVETSVEGVNTNRKTSTVRIIIYRVQNFYRAACLVLESEVTQNSRLLHDSERKFQLKVTATFSDLKNKINEVNKQFQNRRTVQR